MRKIWFSLVPILLAGSGCALAAPSPVTVEGGQINFTGSIVAAPCAVEGGSGQAVILGQVPVNRLAAKGDTSSSVPFNIKLTGCNLSVINEAEPDQPVSYTNAKVTFRGATAGDDSTLAVQPTAGGAGSSADIAKGVGIQISQNNSVVKVDGSTATTAQKISNGTNEIPFSAAYVATGESVVAGSANSLVNFQVTYE